MVTHASRPSTPRRPTLVLGASGRIGQALVRFAGGGEDLRLQTRSAAAVGEATGARGATGDWHVFAPLKEPAALRKAAGGCDQILCLAGVTPASGGDLADNTRLALAAVDAAAEMGCRRVVLASSAAVYGAGAGVLHETQALAPVQAYGQAKAEMETAAAARGQDLGVAVSALRIGNVAGFDAILGGWRPGFTLDQFGDGRTPRRSYIGVETLARCLADLLEHPDLPAVLNVAQPGGIEMGDLLRAGGHAFDLRPAPETALAEVVFDLSRLQACLPHRLVPADPNSLVAEWRAFCQKGAQSHSGQKGLS